MFMLIAFAVPRHIILSIVLVVIVGVLSMTPTSIQAAPASEPTCSVQQLAAQTVGWHTWTTNEEYAVFYEYDPTCTECYETRFTDVYSVPIDSSQAPTKLSTVPAEGEVILYYENDFAWQSSPLMYGEDLYGQSYRHDNPISNNNMWLVYQKIDANGVQSGIYTVAVDGSSSPIQISDYAQVNPIDFPPARARFSPDSQYIVYSDETGIHRVKADGTGPHLTLVNADRIDNFIISANSQYVVAVQGTTTYTVPIDRKSAPIEVIINSGAGTFGWDTGVIGDWFVFFSFGFKSMSLSTGEVVDLVPIAAIPGEIIRTYFTDTHLVFATQGTVASEQGVYSILPDGSAPLQRIGHETTELYTDDNNFFNTFQLVGQTGKVFYSYGYNEISSQDVEWDGFYLATIDGSQPPVEVMSADELVGGSVNARMSPDAHQLFFFYNSNIADLQHKLFRKPIVSDGPVAIVAEDVGYGDVYFSVDGKAVHFLDLLSNTRQFVMASAGGPILEIAVSTPTLFDLISGQHGEWTTLIQRIPGPDYRLFSAYCPSLALVQPTPPSITSTPPANGIVDVAYSHILTATGDTPITFSTSDPLPDGLILSGATISGTPTVPGTFTGEITATNTAGTDTQAFSITILDPAGTPPRLYPLPDAVLDATNYDGPYFRFRHVEGTEWYRVWIGKTDGTRYFDQALFQWFDASDICVEDVCTLDTPVWLTNDDYAWWITRYSQLDPNFGQKWNLSTFSVNFDPPATTVTMSSPADGATVTQAPSTISWARDVNVHWYRVWFGPETYSEGAVYFAWVDATDPSNCDATTCTIDVNENTITEGEYHVYFQVWGPNGFYKWGGVNGGQPQTFTVGSTE